MKFLINNLIVEDKNLNRVNYRDGAIPSLFLKVDDVRSLSAHSPT